MTKSTIGTPATDISRLRLLQGLLSYYFLLLVASTQHIWWFHGREQRRQVRHHKPPCLLVRLQAATKRKVAPLFLLPNYHSMHATTTSRTSLLSGHPLKRLTTSYLTFTFKSVTLESCASCTDTALYYCSSVRSTVITCYCSLPIPRLRNKNEHLLPTVITVLGCAE